METKLDLKINDEAFEKKCLTLIRAKVTELVRKGVDAEIESVAKETLKKREFAIEQSIKDELTEYEVLKAVRNAIGENIRECIKTEFLNPDGNFRFDTKQMITEIMKEVLDEKVKEYVREEINRCLKSEIHKLVEAKVADTLKEVLG